MVAQPLHMLPIIGGGGASGVLDRGGDTQAKIAASQAEKVARDQKKVELAEKKAKAEEKLAKEHAKLAKGK